jgi:rSAM/selenodomain-associated transferase 2
MHSRREFLDDYCKMLSIIIPIYNEEEILQVNSGRLCTLSKQAELIFVDGGSTDKSIEIARRYGRVLQCGKGRAMQMNFGAKHAECDNLLFLHADNFIDSEALLSIGRKLENGFIGGCLTQRIDKRGVIYRLIEAQGNIRARLSKVFYGDQGIFVKKNIFSQLGGFPEVPIMEDVIFTKKLRKTGNTIVLANIIFVSPRRWDKDGIIRTVLRYNLINMAFKFGVPLEKIKGLYEDVR